MTNKKKFTWDDFIKIVTAHYPKATPEKIYKHVQQTYGENILKSSWKYEACWLYYHQRKLDKGKRNSNGKLISKFETCFKVAGSEGFKTWWPRFTGRSYSSIKPGGHARNLQMLVNKNKNLLKQLSVGRGYYRIINSPRIGTGLGHTKKF
tara:strand:- start:515 stop:964 length:450 start_codon:yes stop_codon:yes gene_type:complete